eukprot:Polyplicarium_translucidae@DN5362_c0_g1_i1.p1
MKFLFPLAASVAFGGLIDKLTHDNYAKYVKYESGDISQKMQKLYEQVLKPDHYQHAAHEFLDFFTTGHKVKQEIDPLCGLGKPRSELKVKKANEDSCNRACYNRGYYSHDCDEFAQIAVDSDFDSCQCAAQFVDPPQDVAIIHEEDKPQGCLVDRITERWMFNEKPASGKHGHGREELGCSISDPLDPSQDIRKVCMCSSQIGGGNN